MQLPKEDFINNYREYTSSTIVPHLYNEWAAVLGVSSILSQQTWIERGHYKIFPNLYAMLIGKPGTGKGTTTAILKGVLENASYSRFAPDRTTKEKFLLDLEEGFENSHTSSSPDSKQLDDFFTNSESTSNSGRPALCSDVFILAEEFNDFMGTDNIEFITMLTGLWSYKGTYRQRIKTGKSVAIPQPCINLLGGNTHEGFSMAFPSRLLGQGFLARFILVYGSLGNSEEIAFPESPIVGGEANLGRTLASIKDRTVGRIEIESEAKLAIESIVQTYRGPDDARFENYRTRRFVQFLKLCIVFSASAGEQSLSIESIIRANTLLVATEAEMGKALGEFGKSKNSEVANKIMQTLYSAHRPISLMELWKLVAADLNKMQELSEIMTNLQGAEKIKLIPGKAGGWLPNLSSPGTGPGKAINRQTSAVNWVDQSYCNYLRGM